MIQSHIFMSDVHNYQILYLISTLMNITTDQTDQQNNAIILKQNVKVVVHKTSAMTKPQLDCLNLQRFSMTYFYYQPVKFSLKHGHSKSKHNTCKKPQSLLTAVDQQLNCQKNCTIDNTASLTQKHKNISKTATRKTNKNSDKTTHNSSINHR